MLKKRIGKLGYQYQRKIEVIKEAGMNSRGKGDFCQASGDLICRMCKVLSKIQKPTTHDITTVTTRFFRPKTIKQLTRLMVFIKDLDLLISKASLKQEGTYFLTWILEECKYDLKRTFLVEIQNLKFLKMRISSKVVRKFKKLFWQMIKAEREPGRLKNHPDEQKEELEGGANYEDMALSEDSGSGGMFDFDGLDLSDLDYTICRTAEDIDAELNVKVDRFNHPGFNNIQSRRLMAYSTDRKHCLTSINGQGLYLTRKRKLIRSYKIEDSKKQSF